MQSYIFSRNGRFSTILAMCNLLLLLGDSIETNFVLYSSYEIEPAYLAVMVGFLTPVGDCEFCRLILGCGGSVVDCWGAGDLSVPTHFERNCFDGSTRSVSADAGRT